MVSEQLTLPRSLKKKFGRRKAVIQNLFFAQEIPDDVLQDGYIIFNTIGLANRKKSDVKEAQNEGKVAKVKVLKSAVMLIETEAFQTSKTPQHGMLIHCPTSSTRFLELDSKGPRVRQMAWGPTCGVEL